MLQIHDDHFFTPQMSPEIGTIEQFGSEVHAFGRHLSVATGTPRGTVLLGGVRARPVSDYISMALTSGCLDFLFHSAQREPAPHMSHPRAIQANPASALWLVRIADTCGRAPFAGVGT